MRRITIAVFALLFAYPAHSQLSDPSDRGVAFGHVHVSVADVQLHKKLWTELLGAALVEKEGFTAVSVPGALVFFADAEPTAPSVETAMDHFGFEVRSIEDVLAKWRALGYEVDSEATNAGGSKTASLTMPGGIRLELLEDADLPVHTRMGHIHFMTPMRSELVSWYAENFGANIPGADLIFGDSAVARAPTESTAIDHIGFEVENWDEYIDMLESNNIEFEFGPKYFESLDLWVAFFTDPSGVLVEVTHGLDHF